HAPVVLDEVHYLSDISWGTVWEETHAPVVLDEVHYLSDSSRGTVWEETVIYCPKSIQLVCLSATVANPDELADWIGR
ncbi:unnamed protein product, partial [Closterium sp. NIES-54]